MKRYKYLFITLVILYSSQLFISSEDYSQLKMKISYSNPQIYREHDEVYIEVKIYNPTNEEISALISRDKKFSFDFEMVTMQNRPVYHSEDYITSFNKVQRVFNSQIRLNSDEGYSYIVKLNDYFKLDMSGQYFIRALYYPELKLNSSKDNVIYSNFLTLNIRPGDIEADFILEQKETEEEIKLFTERRPPDEVVDFMLKARMNEQWEKYFLYLKLEKLILLNNNFKERYRKSDSETRHELLARYKEYLKQNTIEDISFLPHSYKIIKTEYSAGRGKVEVILQFKYLDYIEEKYYTYFLEKDGNIWYIYNYEVRNLGVK